jgi:hypothetical protein
MPLSIYQNLLLNTKRKYPDITHGALAVPNLPVQQCDEPDWHMFSDFADFPDGSTEDTVIDYIPITWKTSISTTQSRYLKFMDFGMQIYKGKYPVISYRQFREGFLFYDQLFAHEKTLPVQYERYAAVFSRYTIQLESGLHKRTKNT